MKKTTLTQTLVNAAKDLKFEKATVDKLQALNIPEVKTLSAKEIKRLRAKMNASQGVFARYLNVNPSTLQKWEQGTVSPQNAALKLLNLIQKHGVNILLEEIA
jgi:putative transcriptional regulator